MTFGDGAKGLVIGSGLLKVPSMPKLENFLLMNGMMANFMSISQLRGHNLFFNFTKDKCYSVIDNTNTCVIEGKRSLDNCYMLTSLGTCCTTLLNNSNIWHKRLGHISHRNLIETIAADAVMGYPKMRIDLENVCCPCQIRKQIWISHKMMQHPSTIRVLELRHI